MNWHLNRICSFHLYSWKSCIVKHSFLFKIFYFPEEHWLGMIYTEVKATWLDVHNDSELISLPSSLKCFICLNFPILCGQITAKYPKVYKRLSSNILWISTSSKHVILVCSQACLFVCLSLGCLQKYHFKTWTQKDFLKLIESNY